MTAPDLDVQHARTFFPALETSWAFFENAGGSVVPRPVIDRVRRYMEESFVQLGASHALSVDATERVDAGHRAAAELVNASVDEVMLNSSTTMNVFILATALRPTMETGDQIVVTNLDHEANSGAWRRLADTGVEIREWKLNPDTAALHAEDLSALLTDRTRLVCFTHCSNVVGTLHDVAAIARLAHDAGAMVCVDGVAFAPHRRVDVQALGVDFYLLSLYKLYGPHMGLMYGRREHLERARSVNHYFVGDGTEGGLPYRFMPGNVVHELCASLPGILEYLDAVHDHAHGADEPDRGRRLDRTFELFARHEERVVAPLIEWLAARPGVRILGHADADRRHRVPTVTFTVDGVHAEEVVRGVEKAEVAIRAGDFYAARAIDALDLRERGGVVRASLVHYNTEEEVSRLIRALEGVL